MIEVGYTPEFIRLYNKLTPDLQIETKKAITLFKSRKHHKRLLFHKLSGRMSGLYSFSVNFKYRIVFEYLNKSKTSIVLHLVGDHAVYKK